MPTGIQGSPYRPLPTRYLAGWLAVTLLVFAYYFWQFGAAFDRFVWSDHLDGYYDVQARGFLSGHLYLPVEPRKELLALPNPWESPANRPYRMLDVALYQGRFYLYHGAAPAVFVFAPWRLVTGHDLPQGVAGFLFCLGGYLFLSLLLMELLNRLPDGRGSPPPLWLFLLLCISLGFAQGVPFLLGFTLVYEVAITSGYFCLSAGLYFLFRTLTSNESGSKPAALCGMFLGLAPACRPDLVLAIAPALVVLLLRRDRRKELIAFLLPVVICGLTLCAYNFARFGNPMEFGLRYLLGEQVYQNVHLSWVNVIPGLYYLLACATDLDPVFPFFRMAIRPPFNSSHWILPSRYFLEPTTGALYLFPLCVLALALPLFLRRFSDRPVRHFLLAVYVYAIGCILFIAATGLNSQRFAVDFLPYLVLISCVSVPVLLETLRGPWRRYGSLSFSAILFYSVTVNILYGLQGPFDHWLRMKPASFVRLARWFSPVPQFRPLLNPSVHVKASFDFPGNCGVANGLYHPLIGVGKFGSRYMLAAACRGSNQLSFYSDEGPNIRTAEATLEHGGQHLVEIEFNPDDRVMSVRLDNKTVLTHPLQYLVTAPSQIRCGMDDTFALKRRFDRQITVLTKTIRP